MAFDKRVLAQKPGEVIFSKGQLIQIYQSDLDYTLKPDRKLLPKRSPPQRITKRALNSYTLEQLDRTPIPGTFSTRRLRGFTLKEGTKLAEDQASMERRIAQAEELQNESEELEAREGHPQDGKTDTEDGEEQERGHSTTGNEDAAILEGGHME